MTPNDFIAQLPSRRCEFAELTLGEPILYLSDILDKYSALME